MLPPGAIQADDGDLPIVCLRCAKEYARFPDLICYIPPSEDSCVDCIQKKRECRSVSCSGISLVHTNISQVPPQLCDGGGAFVALVDAVSEFSRQHITREQLDAIQAEFTRQAERAERRFQHAQAQAKQNPALFVADAIAGAAETIRQTLRQELQVSPSWLVILQSLLMSLAFARPVGSPLFPCTRQCFPNTCASPTSPW
jgi:hypothetical protein